MTLNLAALEAALEDDENRGEGSSSGDGNGVAGEDLKEEIKRLKGLSPSEVEKQAKAFHDGTAGRKEEKEAEEEEEEEETFESLTRKLERDEKREFWFKVCPIRDRKG